MSGLNNSGPPGPNATKEEILKYLLRPIEPRKKQVNMMKPLKIDKLLPLRATVAQKKMATIKEVSSQDGEVIQNKHEDTKQLPSASK